MVGSETNREHTVTTIETLLKTASAEDTQALRSRLRGEVVAADDEQYDTARRVHNLTFDRRPAIIVRPQGTADVAEAVKFARSRGYEIAVRSGGHSAAGHSSVDGSLVIDFSAMKGISIDDRKKTARVEAGVTSGDLAGPAHAYGLSLSTGDTSTVALGGLVTGGGIGWMVRKHGLTIDNLISAEVVTADGGVIRASAREHSDLFWAIRGGGGNFGIVTEFEFKLWGDGSVYGGALVLPATPEVIRGYLDYAVSAPDELTTIGTVMHAPPAPFIPEEYVGKTVLLLKVVYAGDPAKGQRAVQPLRDLADPIADVVSPIPYPVMFNFTAPSNEPAFAAVRSMFSNGLGDETIEAVIEQVEHATTPICMVEMRPLGGAVARVAPGATAFGHRDKDYFVSAIAVWHDPSEDGDTNREWTAETFGRLRQDAAGTYANFLGDEGRDRVREAYPSDTYAKLAVVKARYDPRNVFKFNQNIKPASRGEEQAA